MIMNTPKFAHGQMRLYLLALLGESPKHGYELMQAIEQRFQGSYVPSAGTIYPRLAKLTEEGLVVKRTEGRKTIYAITPAGRAELQARSSDMAQLEQDIESAVGSAVHSAADDLRAELQSSMRGMRRNLKASMRAESSRNISSHDNTQHIFSRKETKNGEITLAAAAERSLQRCRDDIHAAILTADASGMLNTDAVRALETLLASTVRHARRILDASDAHDATDMHDAVDTHDVTDAPAEIAVPAVQSDANQTNA